MTNKARMNVGPVRDVDMRLWRTDLKTGRNIYVLLSNDPDSPSDADPIIGVMESSALAEDVVSSHNGLLHRYGRRYADRILPEKN
jgi:hypothetical protein